MVTAGCCINVEQSDFLAFFTPNSIAQTGPAAKSNCSDGTAPTVSKNVRNDTFAWPLSDSAYVFT